MATVEIKQLNKTIEVTAGKPIPMGVTVSADGINFAIVGQKDKRYELLLYKKDCIKIQSLLLIFTRIYKSIKEIYIYHQIRHCNKKTT